MIQIGAWQQTCHYAVVFWLPTVQMCRNDRFEARGESGYDTCLADKRRRWRWMCGYAATCGATGRRGCLTDRYECTLKKKPGGSKTANRVIVDQWRDPLRLLLAAWKGGSSLLRIDNRWSRSIKSTVRPVIETAPWALNRETSRLTLSTVVPR
jgi:hypothetical protein